MKMTQAQITNDVVEAVKVISPETSVAVVTLPPEPVTFFQKLKAWFKYSETILWARTQTLIGLVTSFVGGLDFSPLQSVDYSSGLSNHQVFWLGFGIVVNGVFTEMTRRRNMMETTGGTVIAKVN